MVEQFKLLRSGNIEVTFIFTEQKLEKWKKNNDKVEFAPRTERTALRSFNTTCVLLSKVCLFAIVCKETAC